MHLLGSSNAHTVSRQLSNESARHTRIKLTSKKKTSSTRKLRLDKPATEEEMTIDTLVAVIQDPDKGVPRATMADMKDIKTHRGKAMNLHKANQCSECTSLNPFPTSRERSCVHWSSHSQVAGGELRWCGEYRGCSATWTDLAEQGSHRPLRGIQVKNAYLH